MNITNYRNGSIAATKSWCFAESLSIVGSVSGLAKAWTASVPVLAWAPDYAIVRSIAYTQTVLANGNVDPNLYVLISNLSGNTDYLGCFAALGAPSAAGVACPGSINTPHTVIQIGRPLDHVNFQVMTVSQALDDTLISAAQAAQATAPNGQVAIVIEFIKLEE